MRTRLTSPDPSPSTPSRRPRAAALVLALAGLLLLTAAAGAQDDGERLDQLRTAVERVRAGDCRRALALGEDLPMVLALGRRAYLGVEATSLTPELRRHFGAPEESGVLVGRVEEGSPAAAAGLAVGDVLTRFDGDGVSSPAGLGTLVRDHAKEDVVEVEVVRDGRPVTLSATLDERQRCGLDLSPALAGGRLDLEALPRIQGLALPEFDEKRLQEIRERLDEALESRELEGQLERMRGLDMSVIEERLEEVTKRLRKLEAQLEKERRKVDDGGDGDRR